MTNKSAAVGFVGAGATDAGSLNAFDAVSLLICMLPSSAEVDAVVAGPVGLLSIRPRGALIVDTGSSDRIARLRWRPKHAVMASTWLTRPFRAGSRRRGRAR